MRVKLLKLTLLTVIYRLYVTNIESESNIFYINLTSTLAEESIVFNCYAMMFVTYYFTSVFLRKYSSILIHGSTSTEGQMADHCVIKV